MRNYLRVRGEYLFHLEVAVEGKELPPRARRIPPPRPHPRLGRNYLRVRGEYLRKKSPRVCKPELPPRARRIRRQIHGDGGALGTTSACAENTFCLTKHSRPHQNYLRVRGEYRATGMHRRTESELPPRARRIPTPASPPLPPEGTTSACAENTPIRRQCLPDNGNYLRVRGEYVKNSPPNKSTMELPPRARRIP